MECISHVDAIAQGMSLSVVGGTAYDTIFARHTGILDKHASARKAPVKGHSSTWPSC